MMSRTLTALLMISAQTAAAISTQGWPLTPQESTRLENEHAIACEGLSSMLDGVERRRKAYEGAADPDAALEDWATDLATVRPALDHVFEIYVKVREGIGATDAFLIVKALVASKTDDKTYSDVSPEYVFINEVNNRMDVRTKKLTTRYGEESGLHKDAKRERARRREHAAENRLMLAGLAAAGIFFLLLAIWVKRRPKPPTSSIIKL